MNRNAIVRLILFAILAVTLVGILIAGICLKQYGLPGIVTIRSSDALVMPETSFSAQDIDSLTIDWVAGTVYICTADTDEISVRESVAAGDESMVLKKGDSTLYVEYSQSHSLFSLGSHTSKDLYITVPKDWVCKKLEIDSASADTQIQNLIGKELEIETASGKHTIENCTFDKVDVKSASGSLVYSGIAYKIELDSASAGAEITLRNVPKSIKMDSASGDLYLTLPRGCGFTLDKSTLSGSCSTQQDTTERGGKLVHGDGSCEIKVNGLSSSISIQEGDTITPNTNS